MGTSFSLIPSSLQFYETEAAKKKMAVAKVEIARKQWQVTIEATGVGFLFIFTLKLFGSHLCHLSIQRIL